MKNFYGIAIYKPKNEANLGMLMRSAYCFGASFLITIGNRYRRQSTDTTNTTQNVPYFSYPDWDSFLIGRPVNMDLVSVEVNGRHSLKNFCHPPKALYILGGEDITLPDYITNFTKYSVKIETSTCLNLAICGSILLYDRQMKL